MSSLHDETKGEAAPERNIRVRSWLSRMPNPIRHWLSPRPAVREADLDEVSKEVYLRLQRYSDDVAEKNPQGLLFRIAANVVKEVRERARLQHPDDQSWLEELQTKVSDELGSADARQIVHDHVQAAVKALPSRQRLVLMLHVNEGLTYKQIADRQKLTYREVLRDLTRAYCNLRKRLSPEDLGEIDKQATARRAGHKNTSQ